MLNSILGIKQKMGAVYVKDRRYPVTWVKIDPCFVTQIKHEEKDGYMAVQLATGSRKSKNLTKPLLSHLSKVEKIKERIQKQKEAPRYLREIRTKEQTSLNVGDQVNLSDVLKIGDVVTVTGTSKGKGFAGVVKRHRFAGGPKTHGQSDRERAPGSIGNRTTPGRIFRGKRMAGRMGNERVTIMAQNVVDIDEKNNLIAITGSVPGINGGLIFIEKTGEGGVQLEKEELITTDENKVTETENVAQAPQDDSEKKEVVDEKKDKEEKDGSENPDNADREN